MHVVNGAEVWYWPLIRKRVAEKWWWKFDVAVKVESSILVCRTPVLALIAILALTRTFGCVDYV